MDDRDWSGPLGHSNWGSRISHERVSRWKPVLGFLTVVGMLLSIGHEAYTVDFHPLGVASVTRPVHALLGLIALLWVLFHFRPGRIALILWIVTAIPVLGFDTSMEWVKPLISLSIFEKDSLWTTYENGSRELASFRILGVNFFPCAVAVWFVVLARLEVFPLFFRRQHFI